MVNVRFLIKIHCIVPDYKLRFMVFKVILFVIVALINSLFYC